MPMPFDDQRCGLWNAPNACTNRRYVICGVGAAKPNVDDQRVCAPEFEMLGGSDSGTTKFQLANLSGDQWATAVAPDGYRISKQGSGVIEFHVLENGNATLAGALTENSDVNSKQDIFQVHQDHFYEHVLDQLALFVIFCLCHRQTHAMK